MMFAVFAVDNFREMAGKEISRIVHKNPPCSKCVENKEGILITSSWPRHEDLRSVENKGVKGDSYSRGNY